MTPASAESVPFNCVILPGSELASIMMTNSLASDASCIVTCKFSTTKYDNNPQSTCAKPVPAGKEVEMWPSTAQPWLETRSLRQQECQTSGGWREADIGDLAPICNAQIYRCSEAPNSISMWECPRDRC